MNPFTPVKTTLTRSQGRPVLPGLGHSCAIVCLVTELCSDDDARPRVEVAQLIEGVGHLGQIGDRE